MVVDKRADRIFHALADGTRREIVALALAGDHSVSELARRFPISFAAVQKHVAVLERAGLIIKQRRGREQRVSASVDTLREAHRLLDRLEAVWRHRIDLIGELLAEPEPGPTLDTARNLDTAESPDPRESRELPDDHDRCPEGR
jgi:DNA-binding transcriptional ArsR family regulator